MNSSELGSALVVAVLTLTGCSSTSTAPAATSEPEKAVASAPPVPVTARTAYWEMYKPAYKWAADILPLTVEAKTISGIKNEDGKAAMWEAAFGSPSLKQYTKFTYAVVSRPPDIRKGVTATNALPWAGARQDALPFVGSDWTVDSDAAYKTALAKAEPWLQSHPGKELTTESIGAASRFPGPVWYFLWGDKKDGFFQLISASTGKALK